MQHPSSLDSSPSSTTVLTWSDLHEHASELSERVRAEGIPDVIVGVLRGGMVPAVLIAHQLGVRAVRALEAARTTDDAVNATKFTAPIIREVQDLGDLDGLDVLVVDDVAGSGMTAAAVAECANAAGAARVRIAVVIVNEANWTAPEPPRAALTYIAQTITGWVIFPWEAQP